MAAKQTTPRDRSGPLRRLPGADISTAEAIFEAAMLLLTPDDQTQRKAFEALMPYMYVLRNKGCSWAQLTKLLTDAGFVLQPSTVRSYFGEMLATRQDICQDKMTKQILLMAEIRKDTEQTSRASISKKLEQIMASQAPTTSAKIDSIFGISSAANAAPAVKKIEPPTAARTGAAGDLPIPQKSMATPPEPKKIDAPISKIAAPSARGLDSSAASAAGKTLDGDGSRGVVGGLRCAPLQKDVPELPMRAGVDPHMYEEDVVLEHTNIPGLFLTRAERLYGLALEIIDADGAIRLESSDEKRFRVKWTKPITRTPSSTEGDFAKIDMSLFANDGKRA